MFREWLHAQWFRLKSLPRRRQLEQDLDEELEFHLAMRQQKLVEEGMPAEEARYAARRALGNPTQTKEAARDLWSFPFIETLGQDLRYGLRQLRRNPGFTGVAVLTLALGIGATTTMFSVVNAVLLEPLPYPGAKKLVSIHESLPKAPFLNDSWPDYLDWQSQANSFEQMAAIQPRPFTLRGVGDPKAVMGAGVSGSFFPMLSASPLFGRTFAPSEEKPGGGLVVVLSHEFWQNAFGSDSHVLGRVVSLDNQAATIIGVLRSNFRYPAPYAGPSLYFPIGVEANIPSMTSRANHPGINVIAKLRRDVPLKAARAQMDAVMDRLGREYPKSDRNEKAVLTPLVEQFVSGVRLQLLMLLGAVGLVLVLACANIANIALARSLKRWREFAVRTAIGAGHGRLVRQLITEGFLLSGLGGAGGILISLLATGPLTGMYPHPVFGLSQARVDWRVLLFALGICIISGIVFGLVPALEARGPNLTIWLKGGVAAGRARGGARLRAILVVGEVAISVIVVIGAGLFLRSLIAAMNVDPGFRPTHLLMVRVVPPNMLGGMQRWQNFVSEAVRRLDHLPGVKSTSTVMTPPLMGTFWTSPYTPSGHSAPPDTQEPWTAINEISAGYFRTLQTPLIEGRFFRDSDDATSLPVAIVNESLVRKVAPGEPAIGKRIFVRYAPHQLLQIVGVVKDIKQYSLTTEVMPEAFLPENQLGPGGPVAFMVRVSGDLQGITRSVSASLHGLNKEQPPPSAVPMASVLRSTTADREFIALLVALFGCLATSLAAVGVLGVMGYTVAERTHEIGIRMALGAQRHDVLRMILGQGLSLALIGVAAGIMAALGLTGVVSTLLYCVKSTDPLTYITVSLLMIAVALLACYIPARRAAKVDPIVALRYE
ncbi:MAG TPA: ABC transporter permease [Terriglobia bacterium]|nr:ABC transporter permease [Terriglobia bacterium]